jgi:nitrite reductase/ring-hydroxylating ferredoxin subunit
MLSTEDNELLCRVGPKTPMGKFMREHWVPALLSTELPKADCDPVRVMLLGEKLIAFRDTNGNVGLIADSCPHRGASLFFGRNEDCGIRCVYHGWKFDVTGACVDMPGEPPSARFKDKVRARTYPCHERGGIVWTYMGPRKEAPPLPHLEANELSDAQTNVHAILRECNWLQALEGDIDPIHLTMLHLGGFTPESVKQGSVAYYSLRDKAPRILCADTPAGATFGAVRAAEPGTSFWRIYQFLMPFYVMVPMGKLGEQTRFRAWVPMDDEHTMFFNVAPVMGEFSLEAESYVDPRGVSKRRAPVPRSALRPNASDWYGRFRLEANAGNDYLIDRQRQRDEDYTGIEGIWTQDSAVSESMGPIFDRTLEHLGTSDAAIIRTRRRLLAAVNEFIETGATPRTAEDPDVYRRQSGSAVLPEGADWIEAAEEAQRAFARGRDGKQT